MTFQGRVGCYDRHAARCCGAETLLLPSALAVDPITIYMSDARSTVFAMDKNTRGDLWKQDKLFARQVSAPVVAGMLVAVGDFEGYVHFLDRDDGGFAGGLSTDGSAIKARPLDWATTYWCRPGTAACTRSRSSHSRKRMRGEGRAAKAYTEADAVPFSLA